MVWLGRAERLDSGEGGGSVVCVSAALGLILSTSLPPSSTRAHVNVCIYICVCVQAVHVLHLTNITSMYSTEEGRKMRQIGG